MHTKRSYSGRRPGGRCQDVGSDGEKKGHLVLTWKEESGDFRQAGTAYLLKRGLRRKGKKKVLCKGGRDDRERGRRRGGSALRG